MSMTVDTSGYERMAHSLASMSGTPYGPVVRAETGKVLEGCVRHTRTAKAARIRISVKFRNRTLWKNAQWPPAKRGAPIIAETKDGRVWFVEGKTFYNMTDRRYGPERMARFHAAAAELKSKKTDMARALRARGLAARSWWQIARAMGIEISVPGYVRNAAPYSGKVFLDGRAKQVADSDQYYVEISNSNPTLVSTDGQRILSLAIQARLTHFEIALRKGTFDNLKARAEQFPGVFVS
jgi:hypothetical protein